MTIVDEIPPACPQCGGPALRARSEFCSGKCQQAHAYAANPAKRRQQASDWAKRNPQQKTESGRKWKARNPDKVRSSAKKAEVKYKRPTRARIAYSSRGEYRSGMEARLVPPLLQRGAEYESLYLRYLAKPRGYTPDVTLPNGIAIEIKGWFKAADRSKMLAVKEAHPALDIRMVLATPYQKIAKGSATTHSEWCSKHGIPWADNCVPEAWLNEPTNEASKALLDASPKHPRRSQNK